MAEVAAAIGLGQPDRFLREEEMRLVVAQAVATGAFADKRVLVLIPDGTRTMPMPRMFQLLEQEMRPHCRALEYIVALGTHPPMTDAQLSHLIGAPVVKGLCGAARIHNHHWENPANFAEMGVIAADEIERLSEGRLRQDVHVRMNRMLLDFDVLLVCGPVFPHEVVGFSGGNKYFTPGVAGPEIINFTHWLGALIGSSIVIGSGYTPVRAVIDKAASLIPRTRLCLSLVVGHDDCWGMYFGAPEEAWRPAAALSSQVHIRHIDKPYHRILAVMPELYDDLWTGAKGMYKSEPALADGGEVIIYAPHITEVSYTHGKLIDEIGYHCREYFTSQWERFRDYPGGILAHSTHVRGLGSYDAATGVERPRVSVTLATGIPEERCRRINLGYCDPASIRIDEWRDREDEGVLLIPRAGEILYRLRAQAAK